MLPTIHLHQCLTFLLFVVSGVDSVTVEGQKGGDITLSCNSSNRENLTPVLIFGFKTAYGYNQDEHFRGRVQKSGSCDLNLRDLKTSDAGRYILKLYLKRVLISSLTYDLIVHVNLTGREGEELVIDVLPREAESVEHFRNAVWKEVWRRGKGVLTDRLTERNKHLTIKNFTSSDEGTYRALTSNREVLVTVTVTESGTGVKDKLNSTHQDEIHDTERARWVWIVIVIVALVALIAFAVIVKRACQKKNEEHSSYQGVPAVPCSDNRSAEDPVNTSLQTESADLTLLAISVSQ